MKILRFVYILICVLFICSCSNKSNNPNHSKGYVAYKTLKDLIRKPYKVETIDVTKSRLISSSVFLHNYTSEPSFIQLDNNVPLGRIDKIRKYKNKFYILSDDKIFIFSDNGRYVKTIDYKGHGHNEYLVLRDFQILPAEKLILGTDDRERKFFKFSLNTGECLGSFDEVVGSPFARKIGKYYFHSLLYGNDDNEKDSHLIVVTDGKKMIAKQFVTAPLIENALVENNLYDNGNTASFIPLYSDTVYTLNDDLTYYPKYVVKQEKSLWSKKNERLTSEDVFKIVKTQGYSYLSPGMFIEAKEGIVFNVTIGCEYGMTSKFYYYDKKDKMIYEIKTYVFRGKIDRIFPDELCFAEDNTIYGYYRDLSSYKFLLESGQLKKGRLRNLIEKSKKGDNPVIVEFKLKK